MIQIIVFTIIAIWLAWGLVNLIWGLGQILLAVAYGIAAIVLYTLATILELTFSIFPNRKASPR